MSLSTYLYFDGQCEEAFNFYKSVFGGEFMVIQTFGDGPPDMGVADGDKGRIMHVSLPVGDSVLMGSDTVAGHGEPAKPGNNFAISYRPASKAEADDVFAKLSAGGNIAMPLDEVFWGAYFGMCTDKFGVRWMLNMESSG